MLAIKYINRMKHFKRLLPTQPTSIINIRHKSDNKHNAENPEITAGATPKLTSNLGDFGTKYEVFRDQDSKVILDVIEERNKYDDLLEEQMEEDLFKGISLERGINGVFDIEDLVEVLRRENAEDIFVASVPKDIKYVNYICVVTGRSVRHMQAIAQFVRKVYKQKMKDGDLIPRLEGGESKDWMALDLGNIALHIFSRKARLVYDLDSLWAVGPQFDSEYNKQDPVAEMLEKHSTYLQDLQPAS